MEKVIVPYQPSRPLAGLGCTSRSLGFLGAATPSLSPIVASMRAMRKRGMSPKIVMLYALKQLQRQGEKTITQDMQNQLLQGVNSPGLSGFGALGYGGTVSSAGGGAATGASLGSAFPVVGTAIGAVVGAVVGEAVHLMQRHVGKAEAAWTSPGFYASLRTTQGRDYDEHGFSEAFKGMMDTGNNIVPGCGPDRHKDPDCLLGPMANVIAQGYLSGAVPLSATTPQVFQQVVTPWLQSGANGLVNWKTLVTEPTQMLMMQAAADRYLAGEAMTRGDMPSYGNQGAKTPTLVQQLAPILTPANTGVPAPAPAVPNTPVIPYAAPVVQQALTPIAQVPPAMTPQLALTTQLTPTATTSSGTPVVPPDQTAALIAQMQAQGASQQAALNAAIQSLQAQGVNTSTPQMQQQLQSDVAASSPAGVLSPNVTAAGVGAGLPDWITIGVGGLALIFFLSRPQQRGKPDKSWRPKK